MSSITDFFNKRFTIHLFRTAATGIDKSKSGTQKRLFDRKKGKLLWYIHNPEPEPESSSPGGGKSALVQSDRGAVSHSRLYSARRP